MSGLTFNLSKTCGEFVNSDAGVNILISPAGEGKTYAAVVALVVHAKRCGKPIRVAIIRDTHENIKNSTAVSIKEVFEEYPDALKWRDDFKKLHIDSDPPVDVDLFGIDDPGALSKLQGPQYALVWLEEPAPIADKLNAGLSEEVYNAALLRCARQKGIKPRLQVTMNPADEDHWTYKRFVEEPDFIPEFPLVTKRVFWVPYGENKELAESARQFAMFAYKDDPAAYARYVEGRFAPVYRGIAVTPNYSRERHMKLTRSKIPIPLLPAPGLEGFCFCDSWSNPSAVLGQITQTNRLIFLDTVRLAHSDIKTLMELKVVPLLESPRWAGKCRGWRIGGDATMLNMDQSNSLSSAARTVESFFPGCSFEPGPREWNQIEPHLNYVLTHNDPYGEPLILLSGDNKILDKGLSGGWHYRKNNSGERASSLPVKDASSHPCDAWANAVCKLLPSRISYLSDHLTRVKEMNARLKRRANAYSTSRSR